MRKAEVVGTMTACGLVPVVRAERAEQAINISEALLEGGINVVEITMTVPGAINAMEKVADKFGDRIVLGAGTVLDAETARTAILAGARFIVSPSLNDEVIALARRYSVMVCPGALTPTEVIHAWESGADLVKIFPCGEVGGAKYIKSLKGPFPQVEMIPTGGVNLKTAADFISAGSTALGVGTALVDKKAVSEGAYEIIVEKAKQFIAVIKEARAQK
ncbi:MAG: bifunctional 4-hydroxy-2-oxoglutarate aldolase/2-dehydro-3-deoxy-phosphogluconate aldolase [Chitinivibrionales bacterium]|nr:bifunctional 4-hydroxy-2-oxoglutarate aldolase/2-dehydro-3-deoxy-phosphogluconate aldolase [Chitinivibrionales bacterium]MBD3357907.1 bifunctional 4-hydroxy-2-oxoglutarate aldolase/2-dehydro-3-deoxy-phosphogluconate aldolase [Chitinivibrionales bacterium]